MSLHARFVLNMDPTGFYVTMNGVVKVNKQYFYSVLTSDALKRDTGKMAVAGSPHV